MSAASERSGRAPTTGRGRRRVLAARLGWPALVVGLFAGALILRLWGLKTGLPYVYNADENSHFVPRAIGMFGHDLNPDYFINPPAYTYVLHALFTVRWGTDPAVIGGAFAADPTTAFALARAASGFLGALAVALLAIAGARLFEDKRVGALAAALLAVAFLPVHYSHFALNDVPTLAPLCAALIGIAGIYRTGRTREYVLAGVALGVAIATKYQAGIVLVTLVAAAFASPVVHARVRNLALALGLLVAGFVAANPYALLDHQAFREALEKQTETAGEEGGKLGLANTLGWRYYLGTFTWGFGWLPSVFALGGAVALVVRQRRLAILLAPAPLLLFLYLGEQARFFARWMLPIYPILCLLAAYAAVALVDRLRVRPALVARRAVGAAARQGLVFSVHNDLVLARADTRWEAREWMKANIPAGSNIVMEPIAPDQWAMDAGRPMFEAQGGTGSGNRWNKWRTSRSCFFNGVPAERRLLPGDQARGLRAHDAREPRRLLREGRLLLGRDRLDAVRPRLRGPGRGARRAALLRRAAQARRGRVPDRQARSCRSRSTTRSTTTR